MKVYQKNLFFLTITTLSYFPSISQYNALSKNTNKDKIVFFSDYNFLEVEKNKEYFFNSLPYTYQVKKDEPYFFMNIKNETPFAIEKKFIRNVFFINGATDSSSLSNIRRKDNYFEESDFYYTITLKNSNKEEKKIGIQLVDPEVIIKPATVIGEAKGQVFKSVHGVQIYDPIMGAKKSMVNLIEETMREYNINPIYLSSKNKDFTYESTVNYLMIKPVIKSLYFNYFHFDYYYHQGINPYPKYDYRNVVTMELEMDWQVFNGKKVFFNFPAKVIMSHRTSDYKEAFNRSLENSTKVFLTNTWVQSQLKEKVKETEEHFELTKIDAYSLKTKPAQEMKQLIKLVKPAVVTIHDKPNKAFGSGFIINPEGYIVTNFHVIEDASKLSVQLYDDTTNYPVKVIRVHEHNDLALLKIEKTNLSYISFNYPEEIETGESVLALGTPGDPNLSQSVSKGIISGYREIEDKKYLQTDVSISPGNSGGPLINEKGGVVGVVERKIMRVGYEGLSFCIPVSVVVNSLGLNIK